MTRKLTLLACVLASCSTTFNESHFFAVPQKDTDGRATGKSNYFRMEVSGRASFSAARYVSGYYDKRAVDLFFNEIESGTTESTVIRPLFVDDQDSPGTDEAIAPLEPPDEFGSFVMVFSTNAKAITDAIGQFAENQVIADAITNIANRDVILRFQEADSEPAFESDRAKATATELEALMDLVPTDGGSGPGDVKTAYLRVFNLLARAKGRSRGFDDFDDAVGWFREQGE